MAGASTAARIPTGDRTSAATPNAASTQAPGRSS